MGEITSGNVKDITGNRGWFIGNFIEDEKFNSDEFEVKWASCRKGWTKGSVEASMNAKTMCILISGKFLFKFPEENKKRIIDKEGDFVFWSPGTWYESEALEDSVLLVIRWPSIPGDKKKMAK